MANIEKNFTTNQERKSHNFLNFKGDKYHLEDMNASDISKEQLD